MNTSDVNTGAQPSGAQPVQYDGWDDKGTPIVRAKHDTQPKTQDSAPADKPEAKAESAAEAGAAKDKTQESKPQKKDKLTADERIAQLEATIAKIKEAKGEQQPTKTAEPSPAKPQTNPVDAIKAELAALKKPNANDFKGEDAFDKYEAAKDDYYEKRSDLKTKSRRRVRASSWILVRRASSCRRILIASLRIASLKIS